MSIQSPSDEIMNQVKVILQGIVEGQGIRPALHRFSVSRHLHGYAVNMADHTEAVWQGADLDRALQELPSILPPDCRIASEYMEAAESFPDFSFRQAPRSGFSINLAAPPDRVPCKECLAEIRNPENRRYRHAFNACAVCGPRTTVLEALPYDRENTSWKDFPLCEKCRKEYGDPADRRFHIQGISCPDCGPHISEPGISGAAEALESGKILALKGVGGFQLLCDAFNNAAVQKLRAMKHRPHKPLALMAGSLETVRRFFDLSPAEEALLTSPAGPAVLLHWRDREMPLIAPDTPDTAAVMLPSSVLHVLILEKTVLAVATSCNLPGRPPAMEADDIPPGADVILTHDRVIRQREDDSLCAVQGNKAQILRRARGFSHVFSRTFRKRILSLGAGMKNTFALSDGDRWFLSTHYGDLEEESSYTAWKCDIRRTLRSFPVLPEEIVCDLHPDYPSSRFAQELATELSLPLRKAPHHAAHALAALLDAGLDRALVFVFDGTGLWPDGVLRGAELFDMDLHGECRHIGRWKSVPLPGGDQGIRHPYRQLAARRIAAGVEGAVPHVSESEYAVLKNLCQISPKTASAGRLFDAAAAQCGAAPVEITYDGQSASRLEYAARREQDSIRRIEPDYTEVQSMLEADWSPLFRTEFTPREFHESVADCMVRMAEYGGHGNTVLFSGGVFQNRLLTSLAVARLEKAKFKCIVSRDIPVNDGGISAGQLLWSEYGREMRGESF